MLILTLTAGVSKLHPAECEAHQVCMGPTPWQLVVLFSAFGFLMVGAGGIRPCNLAFGADQFDPTTESGKRGINSFFNWYYVTFTFAVLVSSTIIIYIQSNISWTLGLAIPTIIMSLSCAAFFLGSRLYVKIKPQGSPFAGIAQVLVAAFRKRGIELTNDSLFDPPRPLSSNSKLQYTHQFRFLDKAATLTPEDQINPDGTSANPWRLSSLQQVEEAKCILRILPVWSSCVPYHIAVSQHTTYVVFQALQSDRHLGNSTFQIPAASFTIFSMIALTIWIPIYDRIIVPWLRRTTGKEEGITLLQRMGIGLTMGVFATVVAAFVEERRKSYALHQPTIGVSSGGGAISSMSSLWLVPQLVVFGLSEAFTVIGQIEFYYKQFPENMRSVAGSLFFLGIAVSSYMCGLMVTVIHEATGGNGRENWLASDLNKGRLEWFYFMIAVVGVLNFMYFIVCARWYRYKGLDVGPEAEIALKKTESKAPPV